MKILEQHINTLHLLGNYQNGFANKINISYDFKNNYFDLMRNKYNFINLFHKSDLDFAFIIMRWVHEHLLFQKSDEYTGDLNADSIISYAKNNKIYVNCLCHAIVLTQCLIAAGYPARYISCLPMDGLPFDNHVVTEAFIKSINKWILLDATANTYFINNSNQILSLVELRNHIISHEKITIKYIDRFNANGAKQTVYKNALSEDKIFYLYAKNLYILEYYNYYGAYFDDMCCYRLIPEKYMPGNSKKILYKNGITKQIEYIKNCDILYYNPYEVKP